MRVYGNLDFFARSGFYTNRIRYSEMISLMQEAGFNVDVVRFHKWDKVPIKRQKLHPSFVHSSEEDLLVSGFTSYFGQLIIINKLMWH